MAIAREVTDAHTGTDIQILIGHPDRLANTAVDLADHLVQKARLGVVANNQGKFIPSNARQKVLARQLDFFQALSDIGDDLIPRLRAKAIVDGFQAVNVNPEQCKTAGTPAFDLAHQVVQPVTQ